MKNIRQKWIFTAFFAIGLSSCFNQEPVSEALSTTPEVVEIRTTDWSGNATSPDAITRRPFIEIAISTPIDESDQPVMLLSGRLDDALVEDLSKAPLRAGNSERVIRSQIHYRENLITLSPDSALESGAVYTVVVAGWTQAQTGTKFYKDGSPLTLELVVSDDADAGAAIDDCWPADGRTGVAPNLAFAAVHFDGNIQGEQQGVRLEDANGAALPIAIRRESCARVGWEKGVCVVLEPEAPLETNARFRIVVDDTVRDAHGAPINAQSFYFDTATIADRNSPELLPVSCAIDESEVAIGCALIDDHNLQLRLRANEPVRFHLKVSEQNLSLTAPRGDSVIALRDREPDSLIQMQLTATDEAGNRSITPLSLRTQTDLARLSITEVRADPRGPEPEQEFIELLNYGDDPIDLKGFSISDSLDDLGVVIEQSQVVFPNARILLVADDFNAEEPRDDAPLPGTLLVRIGNSLTGSGLANAGEDIFLRDPSGRRVSAAPAVPQPRAGVCIIRVSDQMRDSSEESFDYDPDERCTPGF